MIVDGKTIAKNLEEKLKETLMKLPPKKVCFILFGNDAASKKFVELKSRTALRLGISTDIIEKENVGSTDEAILVVKDAVNKNYDGIVVQLPLPTGIDTAKVLDCVPVDMDIDVLGARAREKFKNNSISMMDPVSSAILEILKFHNVGIENKKILLIGRGMLVGEPVAMVLEKMGANFQVIASDTPEDLKSESMKNADIIISGAGVPCLVKPEMVKDGVVLIDAATSESSGKLVGDIDQLCESKASLYTPVPGGVGPVTVICLFRNLMK